MSAIRSLDVASDVLKAPSVGSMANVGLTNTGAETTPWLIIVIISVNLDDTVLAAAELPAVPVT